VESLGLVHLSRRLDLQMIVDRRASRDVDAVNGAFLLARTDLLRGLGGLDEDVFMYLEDADLCRRVRDAGARVRFVSDARAVHGGGTSTDRGDTGARTRAYLHRIDGDVEFLRRYGRRGAASVAALAFALRALIGLVVAAGSPTRRARYRAALPFALHQLGGRHPAPPV
jgi:GT2 family glycosyltransferase